jgi:hypothetical protein
MSKYYGLQEEKVVVEFLKTNDQTLFHEKVYPLLCKIAYGVCAGKRFKPVSLYRSRTVIDGCVSHLWECLRYKYDCDKKTKTFSYLTQCAFHYFCGVSRTYQKSHQTLALVHKEVSCEWRRLHLKINVESLNEEEEFFRFYYVELAKVLKFKANQLERNKPASPKGPIIHDLHKQMVTVREQDHCNRYIHKKAIYSNTRRATSATTKQIRNTIKKELLPTYHALREKHRP